MRPLVPTLAVALVAIACGRGPAQGGAAPAPERPSVTASEVRLLGPGAEERLEPSFGRGEQLTLAFSLRPAAPPIAAVVRLARGTQRLAELPAARVTRTPVPGGPWIVPVTLPPDLAAGRYRLEAALTDGRGARTLVEARLDYVADAPAAASAAAPASGAAAPSRRPAPPAVVGLTVLDVTGRPRGRYARGERATLTGLVVGARPGDEVHVELSGVDGRYGAVARPAGAGPDGRAPLEVDVTLPPFGPAGEYRLEVTLVRGDRPAARAAATVTVVGGQLGLPERLVIEASTVGGQGGRRVATVTPPRVTVRARLGGFTVRATDDGQQVAVRLSAVLRRPDGRPVGPEQVVGELRGRLPHRPARLVLEGELEVPTRPSTDYLLELRARDEASGAEAMQLRHVSVP